MKKNFHIILAILAFIGIVLFVFNYRSPFEWEPTLNTDDDNPFGCELFDKLASHSLEGNYQVTADIPDSLNPKTDAILYVKRTLVSDNDTDTLEAERGRKLFDFAKQGGIVIVATRQCTNYSNDDLVAKSYGLEVVNENYGWGWHYDDLKSSIKELKEEPQEREIVHLETTNTDYYLHSFMIEHCFEACYNKKRHYPIITIKSTLNDVEFDDQTGEAKLPVVNLPLVFYRTFATGGEMVYVSMPLLFTNYAVMDGKTVDLSLAILSHANGRNLTRIMGVNRPKQRSARNGKNYSVFSYLLSHPPLRWALYLTMIVLVIFCIFNVKRKMRAIPLPPEQKNATLEFAKFMGTYYYRQKKHGAIVLAKYDDMIFSFSKIYGEDVSGWKNQELSEVLSLRTGISSERIITLIRTANRIRINSIELSAQSMKQMLDLIQEINNKL